MKLKDRLKILFLGYKATNESYIAYLRKQGVVIGDDVILFRPFNTTIDIQNPHLLSIGDHVMITGPATILSHDYSWSVIKKKYGYILGNQRKTVIGSNVFIGWGATILGGTVVGDNVIIGAGSVVNGTIESDSVYAGNPAKKIMSLDEYFYKRKSRQLDEAVEYVKEYKKRHGIYPSEEGIKEYFYLFADENNLCCEYKQQLQLLGNYRESVEKLSICKRFHSCSEFLLYCENSLGTE